MKKFIKDSFQFLIKRDPSPLALLLQTLEESHPMYIHSHSENCIKEHAKRAVLFHDNELRKEVNSEE